MDLSPLLAPRSIAVVGATDRDGLLRRQRASEPRASGVRGRRLGREPEARARCSGARASPRSPSCPSRSTRSWSRSRRRSVAGAVLAGAERGCRGAVVLVGRLRRDRGGPRPRARSCARSLARTTCPSAARTATGSSPSPRARRSGATRVGPLRAGLGGDGHPERQRRRSTRSARGAGSAGTPWSRPATRRSPTPATGSRRSPSATGCARWRSSSSPTTTARSSPRRWRCCAERGVGVAVLKVGSSAAGARAAAAHTGSLAGDQRVFRALVEEAGARLGRGLPRPARARQGAGRAAGAPARRRRARGAHLLRRRLGRRRRPGVGDRARAAGPVARDRAATRGAAPRRGDDRQPARLHGDDLGRDRRACARSSPRSATTRRSTSCCSATTTPSDADALLGADPRRVSSTGANDTRAATIVASTLPDLLDDDAALELAERGLPAIAGLRTALALRPRAAPPARRSPRACARSPRRRAPRAQPGDGGVARRGRGEGAAARGGGRGARGRRRRRAPTSASRSRAGSAGRWR